MMSLTDIVSVTECWPGEIHSDDIAVSFDPRSVYHTTARKQLGMQKNEFYALYTAC